MLRIWGKSEFRFALLWITIYITGNSLAAELSGALGIKHCAAAVFHLGMSLFLLFWIRKNGLMVWYGLCKTEAPAAKFLWYIPLVILVSRNLWNGVAAAHPFADAFFSVCSMIGAGFLEELLFRGFLFRAVSRNGVKRGAVISSVSFGLIHIFNLSNGSGSEFAENIWQVVFATAFGFLCVTIFYRGKTLWPCILTHAAFNAASVFVKEPEIPGPVQILQNAAALALVAGYTWILTRTLPKGDADPNFEHPPKSP